jgi:hypothetical protein
MAVDIHNQLVYKVVELVVVYKEVELLVVSKAAE